LIDVAVDAGVMIRPSSVTVRLKSKRSFDSNSIIKNPEHPTIDQSTWQELKVIRDIKQGPELLEIATERKRAFDVTMEEVDEEVE
jgi:hypothetical protein